MRIRFRLAPALALLALTPAGASEPSTDRAPAAVTLVEPLVTVPVPESARMMAGGRLLAETYRNAARG